MYYLCCMAKTIKILTVEDVRNIATVLSMNVTTFITESGTRSAYVAAISRKQEYFNPKTSEKILSYARKQGYKG